MAEPKLTQSLCSGPSAELRENTVGDVLREAAERWPDAIALAEIDANGASGRRWTYAELLADAERLARALLTRYRPGERIVIWAPNAPEWVLLEYASALAGLTLVTANPGYQPRELRYVLEQSGACGLFIVKEHRGNPMARIAAESALALPAVREIVDIEDEAALFALAGPEPSLPVVAPGDPAQIQYTSGTTGFPKGVVLHHRGLVNNARHCGELTGMHLGEAVLLFMPLFHTAGCALTVLGCVQAGGRLLLARQFDPGRMNAIIEQERVERLLGVPTMLIAMLEAQRAQPHDLSSLKVTAAGGSMVPPELVRSVRESFGCDFYTVYGQTEASPLITQTRLDDSLEDICNTVGRPVALTEVSIRCPKANDVLPIGAVGEICVRGYGVMTGYNDNPEATAQAIDADGSLHTGDLGTMDARGFVAITGRVKDMIIRGGENLFPAEIENVLLEHDDVAECAVVGAPDPLLGEVAVAHVRLRNGAALNVPDLVAHCRAQLAAQKTPAHWVAVEEWPLTGSGKIQKFVLRDRWIAANGG